MPNIATVLKEEIRRLARKEAKSQVAALKKASAQQRRDIAALKRQLKTQERASARLAKAVSRGGSEAPAESSGAPAPRISPTWLRKHRAKLGLSAADDARLVGVSGHTIYTWEKGQNKPRAAQLEALASVRGLGKREAIARIGGKTPRGRTPAKKKP
jgi:DNA-binding transcriptional regulator YiaG